mmetsp:Transcript_54529/g.145535  ORF Transcript_54529/g.145535 Transcript_54529/m.145535 type:complete len:458 (-) Transcript_54529:176-1549(-)
MQVRVESLGASNLPEGCYVAVRFGDVQKQSQYDPSKIYRFSEMRRFGKIDLYQKVGTGDLNWNMNQTHEQVCNVDGPLGAAIQLKVSLSAVSPPDVKSSVPTPREARAKVASDKARTYLGEHGIENLLAGTMRSLLKAMPEDPSHFIIDYIARTAPPKTPIPGPPTIKSAEEPVHQHTVLADVGKYDARLADCLETASRRLKELKRPDFVYKPSVSSMVTPLLPALNPNETPSRLTVLTASPTGSRPIFCVPAFAFKPSVASLSLPVLTPLQRRPLLPVRTDLQGSHILPTLDSARSEIVKELKMATKDGRLEAALVKAGRRQISDGSPLSAVPLVPSSFREDAAHILAGAFHSGRLESALHEENGTLHPTTQSRECKADDVRSCSTRAPWSFVPSVGTWLSSTSLPLEPLVRKTGPSTDQSRGHNFTGPSTDMSGWRNVPSVGSWMTMRPLPLHAQ